SSSMRSRASRSCAISNPSPRGSSTSATCCISRCSSPSSCWPRPSHSTSGKPSNPMRSKRYVWGGGALLALAVLFVGLTILFGHLFRGWRLDLTQNGLYTTASGTEHILKGLKEPVNLYFFYSEKLTGQLSPDLKTYGTRVRELLDEMVARSNGKLHLSVIDPQPFSEDEDRANELGVRGAPAGNAGQNIYFGLAGTNSTDGKQAIEFFDPRKEEFLEYDVVKLIYQLSNPKKPVVGWLSTLPMGG